MAKCFKCETDAAAGEVAIWSSPKWYWVRNSLELWSGFWRRWQAQLQPVWNQPDWKIEPNQIYCKNCWKEWGQHVKPGCKYALSDTCEKLAIQVGIQFDEKKKPNPFYCPPCNIFFNHGTASLEKHLLLSHPDSKNSCRKRKLEELTESTRSSEHESKQAKAMQVKGFEEPVLHVSGGSNSRTISGIISGTYIAKSWHHGKPLYRKKRATTADDDDSDTYSNSYSSSDDDENDVPVEIYFWDERSGKTKHGWWFTSQAQTGKAWAYSPVNLSPDDLTVPRIGWRVPYDGDLDLSLKIAAPEAAPEAPAEATNTDVELRWEFAASNDRENQDWQPMHREMNDALEKRWKGGWAGDNGTQTFSVKSNGFTYTIDCVKMVQLNVRTQRTRPIRRGEARPDPEKLLPKLEHFQAENTKLSQETAELVAKVAELERQSVQLKQQSAQLEQEKKVLQGSQVDHAARMISQEAWRMSCQLQTKICTDLSPSDAVFSKIQKALRMAYPWHHSGECGRMSNVTVASLQQVCNTRIWKDYEFRKDQIRKELDGRGGIPAMVSNLPSGACSWAQLDAKINEILLIHGTTHDKTNQIANFGFDERLTGESGLYGQGVYFTDQSCKSLQYSGVSGGWSGSGCVIIARVVLGHPFHARGPMKQHKVEPLVDQSDPSKGRCHSVIAQPGTPTGGQAQVHREFVLFNGAQAYPEMIVHFNIS